MTQLLNVPASKQVHTNGISMAVRETSFGNLNKLPILFLHGFPELSYSWRHQLVALAQAGYAVAAPDLRGYGATGLHGDVDAYRMANLARDVVGLLDAFGVGRAVVVGHDFGGLLAWTLARDHPERVLGIASLNTPYTRRTDRDLIETMRATRGAEHYIVKFQERGYAEGLLGRDVRATFTGLMRRPKVTLKEFALLPSSVRALPASLFVGEPALMGGPLLSEADLDVYVASFEATGFEGPLNWYRNLHRNWLDTAGSVDRVDVPALMISTSHDFLLPPSTTHGMESIVSDLERSLISDCGHWTQQEQPQAVNDTLIEWIGRRFRHSD